MTMKPSEFERYAAPLSTNLSQSSKDNIANLQAIQNVGGFSDVPFFLVNKELAGSTGLPWITGHEGRHRSRAMDAAGVQSGLVQFVPRAELREPFPRRSQEQYIEAIRKEMELSGNKIKPEKYYLDEKDEKQFQRPTIDLPDLYANGGIVKMSEGGEPDQTELDRMRLELNNSPVIQATPQTFTQRAIGTLGGYMNQAGEFVTEAIKPLEERNPVKHFLADMFLAGSLKSAGTALQDYTGTVREEDEDNPVRGVISKDWKKLSTSKEPLLDPRVLDVLGFAQPVAKLGIKGVRAGAKAVTPFAKDVGEMASEMYMRGDVPGMVSPNSYVIKPKGGNWIGEDFDKAISPLKVRVEGLDPAVRLKMVEDSFAKKIERNPSVDRTELEQAQARFAPDIAINNWLSTKLNKYIKNEMGTPEDPIRKLADQGKLHTSTDEFPRTMVDEFTDVSPTGYLGERRIEAGFPAKSYAETLEGKNWEASTDANIQSQKASQLLSLANSEKSFDSIKKLVDENPWLSKVDPDTNIYRLSSSTLQDLNFSHVVDELKNSMRADSDLPERLRIEPSKLEKMTVPQVVERVSEINKWRAEQQVAINEQIANNAATQLVKDYPDQGYKWVELRKPDDLTELPEGYTAEPYKSEYSEGVKIMRPDGTQVSAGDTLDQALKNMSETMLDDALKYEGDTMKHCVGGYCQDVIEGSTRIYSLRDSKGEPHVTIEVQPNPNPYAITGQDFSRLSPAEKAEYGEHVRQWRRRNPDVEELTDDNIIEALRDAGVPPRPDSIIQIKGKGNAKPKDTYLPFVQDFVKSGKWSEINDFKNTGLVHAGIGGELMTPAEHAVWLASRRDAPPNGMKRGGVVRMRDGGDPEREFYDQLREGFSVYNKPTYGNEIPGTPTIDQQRYELTMKGRQEAENRARTTRDNLTAMDPSGTLGIVDALKTVGKSIVAPIAYVGGNAFDWLQTGKVDPAKSKARGERLENWITPKTEEGGELLETIGKIPAQITGSEYGFGMHPNLWVSGIGMTTPKQTAAGLRLGKERVTPFAKDVGSMASELYMSGKMPGMVAPNLYAASPDGKPSKVLAPANEIGFYSPTEAAALNLQRKSGQGQAFLNDIMKGENVKSDEISAMGLDTFLKGKTNVTADEVRDYIAQNKIQLGESTYGAVKDPVKMAERQKVIDKYDPEIQALYDESFTTNNRLPDGTLNPRKFEILDLIDEIRQKRNLEADAVYTIPENKDTKYSEYALPGGENYREIVLTLPVKPLEGVSINKTEHGNWRVTYKDGDTSLFRNEQDARNAMGGQTTYQSSHFDEPNALSHLRVSDRVTDGKKTLLVDEVQSDWHQAGREQGYKNDLDMPRMSADELLTDYSDKLSSGQKDFLKDYISRWERAEIEGDTNGMDNLAAEYHGWADSQKIKGVPDAPYKDDWYQLALRRAIKEAIDGGYDRVALPTGSRVAERFDLSKQIESISHQKNPNGTYQIVATDKNNRHVMNEASVPQDKLSSIVGKDVAQKIINAEGTPFPKGSVGAGMTKLSGLDLQVGGEGMKKYYDEIYPTYLKKFGKKYGANVGKTTTPTEYARDAQGIPSMYPTQEPLFFMEITPAMRKEFSTGIHMKRGGKVQFAKSLDAMRHELTKAK
jgi:hypothetical protein